MIGDHKTQLKAITVTEIVQVGPDGREPDR
jgi:hypothetical protein